MYGWRSPLADLVLHGAVVVRPTLCKKYFAIAGLRFPIGRRCHQKVKRHFSSTQTCLLHASLCSSSFALLSTGRLLPHGHACSRGDMRGLALPVQASSLRLRALQRTRFVRSEEVTLSKLSCSRSTMSWPYSKQIRRGRHGSILCDS